MNDVTEMGGIENVSQSLGSRLRVARTNARFTKDQLARRIGVSIDSVEAWEHGDSVPRANRLQMLTGILNTSLRWLLEGREDKFMEIQSATTPSMGAMHSELERLYAMLDRAKVNVKHSLDRLTELSGRSGDDDIAEH